MKKADKKQESEIVPVTAESPMAPVEEKVTEPEKIEAQEPVKEEKEFIEEKKDGKPKQTFGQIVRWFILTLLRLILLVAILGGCVAAVYFGVPFVYDNFIRPVERNTSQINDINLKLGQNQTQIADLQTRLATLEADQNAQTDSFTEIDARLQTAEAGLADQTESLARLNSSVQTLEAAEADRDAIVADLVYQTHLLKAMELLSRARLFLYQSNFGLARADVQAARDALAEMQATAPESKQQDITEAIFRVDLALKNLPDFPVAASDDLDLAWQILLGGYPVTPTTTPTLFSTPTPELTATPQPSTTIAPTATP